MVGEPALTGLGGLGCGVGWGGFEEIFRLWSEWLVNPPLRFWVGGVWGGVGWNVGWGKDG